MCEPREASVDLRETPADGRNDDEPTGETGLEELSEPGGETGADEGWEDERSLPRWVWMWSFSPILLNRWEGGMA